MVSCSHDAWAPTAKRSVIWRAHPRPIATSATVNFSPVPSGCVTVRTSISPELSDVTLRKVLPQPPNGSASAA